MTDATDRRTELLRVVDAAQRSAGVLAARERGDRDGAGTLLASFEDHELLASGSLLLAELAVHQSAAATGRTPQECLHELCLDMEGALRG
ncbi:hypothetical protein [Arthrobacter sp. NEB 688]|uniref:hypothetical protein n=1 Tax=Arthrobacter sp. NEB 688 TaxID=904039 RepID=UPI001567BBB2|nr:hypothetical protein [Arthrobacter sp. NEB 688]QKE85549.1 hypothetical protein HL663_17535 [Arthrobacter sp. NEB 688]